MQVVRGVEISAEWTFQHIEAKPNEASKTAKEGAVARNNKKSKVHVLGYFTRADASSQLYKLLEELRVKRMERNYDILQILHDKFNLVISMNDVRRAASQIRDKPVDTKQSETSKKSKKKQLSDDFVSLLL
jgi:hypothetical protein